MANRSTEIGRILRAGDIALARRRLIRAIDRAEGNILASSRLLQVDENTMNRWVYRLALEPAVAAARARRQEQRAKRLPG